jgi:hypothetical protein
LVGTLHGNLLGLLADFAMQRPLRRQSREGTAHLDTHEVYLLYREVRMLLDRGPSWRQRGWPQPVNQAQNLGEYGSGDGDLRHLESDVTAVAHDFGPDLDQLFTERGERPVFNILRQR